MAHKPFRIVEAEFVISSPNLKLCPEPTLPEIAVAGRSNVGKSTLINMLCNRRNLAKTSGTPGKTQLLNFFKLRMEPGSLEFMFVDLPGFGYTKTGKSKQEEWGKTIGEFMEKREALAGLLQLVDARHDPAPLDCQMREWVTHTGLPTITVMTKSDKIGRNQLRKSKNAIAKILKIMPEETLLFSSALKKQGGEDICRAIANLLQADR